MAVFWEKGGTKFWARNLYENGCVGSGGQCVQDYWTYESKRRDATGLESLSGMDTRSPTTGHVVGRQMNPPPRPGKS